MSFTDNERTVGLAFIIVGILMALTSLVYIVQMALGDDVYLGQIVTTLGGVVGGAIYAMLGLKVYGSAIDGKLNILGNYIRTVGIVTIVTGLISAVGGAIAGSGVITAVLSAIISIILGLIVLWIAAKMMDGKDSIADRIIWILLVVVFALLLIFTLFGILGAIVLLSITLIVSTICEAIIYLFMLMYLLDYDVKKAMGMAS